MSDLSRTSIPTWTLTRGEVPAPTAEQLTVRNGIQPNKAPVLTRQREVVKSFSTPAIGLAVLLSGLTVEEARSVGAK